jgi:hypothetical protein
MRMVAHFKKIHVFIILSIFKGHFINNKCVDTQESDYDTINCSSNFPSQQVCLNIRTPG